MPQLLLLITLGLSILLWPAAVVFNFVYDAMNRE